MHFLALTGINEIAWGTKLLLTAVLAHPTSSGPKLKTQNCCLSLNGCFSPPLASHLPPTSPHPFPPVHPPLPTRPPTPIDSIRDIIATEKLSEKPAAFKQFLEITIK